ncbi:MAG: hypothetical protein QGF09_07020 [Rhodospirillales bacterium]|nr:hypothetical protein [Rhodospirillales bacterium]
MARFYQPPIEGSADNPFHRDETGKLIRRTYWLEMGDPTVILAMTQGVGANLTADEKRAHLEDIKRDHLIEDICQVEILPPDTEEPGQ